MSPRQPPTGTEKVGTAKVLPRLQSRLRAGLENPVRVASGGAEEWPAEVPVRIDVTRLLNDNAAQRSERIWGHLIDLDFYTKQSRVMIQLCIDPNSLVISVNDDEVYAWTEHVDDKPIGYTAIFAEAGRVGGAFIDQVNLQPGDEVLIGDNGEPVIIRDDPVLVEDDDPILVEEDDEEIIWE